MAWTENSTPFPGRTFFRPIGWDVTLGGVAAGVKVNSYIKTKDNCKMFSDCMEVQDSLAISQMPVNHYS